MGSTKGLEYSIERVVKHYSSLFTLPSYPRIVLFTLLLCVAGGIATIFLFNLSVSRFVLALQFSFLLFSLSTIADLIKRQAFLNLDPVYNTRRCAALSMFSLLLWFGFLLLGASLTRFFNSWNFWVSLVSIGFAAVCVLRLIVLSSTSSTSFGKVVVASLAQPIACLLPMFFVPHSVGYPLDSSSIVYFFFAIPTSILTAFVFINEVNKAGVETFQTPTTSILRAFLANWMENLNAPLENLFENFGREKTIDYSLLAFKSENQIKAVIAVSSFHPGPFKNVGSSLLPFMIQEALEKKLRCVAAVPHGLFGHEFDLSSQQQNQKVLRGMLEAADFANFGSKATYFVREQRGVANAGCQIFGECAVFTLTLAPETTEDFPQKVGDFILEEASKLGLTHAIIINAHNSINSLFDVTKAVEPLKEAALSVLRKALKMKPSSFEVGAARIVPAEFSFENGMGPGGICALVIRVEGQTCAYITIDGNNMVSGLREKVLNALKELSVDEGEVLTTDTHVVNAVVMTSRGYHPLGEAIPHEKLISYIKQAVKEALSNMTSASTARRVGKVTKVKVIGEKQIEEMSLLADKALRRAKKIAVPLFTAAGLFLIGLLVILSFL